MSWPQFIPQFIGETAQSTLIVTIKALNSLQRQLSTILTYLSNKQQLDSVLLQKVQLKPGLNQIPHTLGKSLTGWQATRIRGGFARLADEQDSNPSPTVYLYLVSDVNITVDLLVF